MNTPLGRAAGNWLEVKEAIACLEGRGPADLEEVSIACVANLPNGDADKAREELVSGRPREKFNELIASQGADLKAFESKLSKEVTAPVVRELLAEQDGFVHSCDARIIGELVRDLGGGRQKKDDLIRFDVGIDLLAKPGDHVEEGGVLARVHVDCESDVQSTLNQLTKAFEISVDPPVLDGLIEQLAP
jgi:thymidine phosphorylase